MVSRVESLSPLDTLQPFDTIEVYTLKHYTNVMRQQQRGESRGATHTVVMHLIQPKSKNLDFVSSILCGREKSLPLDIKMHPIFPLFPEGILPYRLDIISQIYPKKQYIYL
jgi:hypothetical protein